MNSGPNTSCLHCPRPAIYVVKGGDGEFLCETHRDRASGEVVKFGYAN